MVWHEVLDRTDSYDIIAHWEDSIPGVFATVYGDPEDALTVAASMRMASLMYILRKQLAFADWYLKSCENFEQYDSCNVARARKEIGECLEELDKMVGILENGQTGDDGW